MSAAGWQTDEKRGNNHVGKCRDSEEGMMDHKADFPVAEHLVSFESGHYKAFTGTWKGDSVWAHFVCEDGRVIHVNKDKVEYIQTKEVK